MKFVFLFKNIKENDETLLGLSFLLLIKKRRSLYEKKYYLL